MSKLTLKTEGDRYVVVTRRFAATPEALYRAHTEPALIQNGCWGRTGGACPCALARQDPAARSASNGPTAKGADSI
jgi:uncharacterized protein YndB with AHSA1/START domain